MQERDTILAVLSSAIALAGLLLIFSGFLFSKVSSFETRRGARILAWGQAYLTHHKVFRCRKFLVTELRVDNKWLGTLSWVVCIMNIDWNQWRHEKGENSDRRIDELFAEHRLTSPHGMLSL